ncbi:MAG: hypothetical protein ACRDQD_28800, partial [Nocardioidaceae bacterium]
MSSTTQEVTLFVRIPDRGTQRTHKYLPVPGWAASPVAGHDHDEIVTKHFPFGVMAEVIAICYLGSSPAAALGVPPEPVGALRP